MMVFGYLRRKRWSLALAAALLVGLISVLSLRNLVYSDPPGKSEIIMLFPVPEFSLIDREALQLIDEGFAGYMCIPTSLSLYKKDPDGNSLSPLRVPFVIPSIDEIRNGSRSDISLPFFYKIRKAYGFPDFYENTHVEMLLAKKVMDASGFRKAIFVSSPYHMKRMKIIAGKIFGPAYHITMVPSRFEKWDGGLPDSWGDLKYLLLEYPKIIWFLCYDSFGPLDRSGSKKALQVSPGMEKTSFRSFLQSSLTYL